MKKFAFILIALLAFACTSSPPAKTYTVEYTVQAVSQYGDTTIINRAVVLNERTAEFSLHQGDLRLITYSTRVSGEVETLMSGVKYFVLIKSDTIKTK